MASRYSNTGLHAAEALFESAHARAGQYLDQAPILVMWAKPWTTVSDGAAQTFARIWIAGHCEAGVGLKEFLRLSGFSAPMRALKGSALQPSHAALYRMLARVPPTVLGRCTPQTAKAQRAWLGALQAWFAAAGRWGGIPYDSSAIFCWCVERFADAEISGGQAVDLLDFQRSGVFREAWGLKRAVEEMGVWHTRITLESQLRGLPVGADDTIDQGRHPDTWSSSPFTFTALRTPRQIAEEGAAMRHCVATYVSAVLHGRAHIVSIAENGQRVATLELGGPKAGAARWRIRQLKGPRNQSVRTSIEAMAMLYSHHLQSFRGR